MNAEFNWWLLIAGLVAGAGLVWLVIADWSRREEDLGEDERQLEAAWIAQVLTEDGEPIDPSEAERVLSLHRAYLRQSGGLEADEPVEAPIEEVPAMLEPEVPIISPGLPMSAPDAKPAAEPVEAPEPALPRPSVRSRPISPRGSTVRVESEPPRPS